MRLIGWQIEKLPGCNIFVRHLPLVSFLSVAKVQRAEKVDLEAIKKISKKHRSILTKIEPLTEISLKKDNWPLLPSKTLILDLKSLNLPKDTRYEIRKADNLKVELSTNIDLFYKLLEETMKIGHWSVPIKKEVKALWQAFQPKNSQILLIPNLAACLIIWEGNTAHYMYAALTKEGRKVGAAYKLLWETIEFCKTKNIDHLDLEGIYDDRYKSQTKNWQGFTKFKMGWNGREVVYPGSYCLYRVPII